MPINLPSSNVMTGTYGPYFNAGAPTSGTNEVQTITGTSAVGTFTITFRGQTTSALSGTATAAQIQTALRLLSSINVDGVTGVTCTGGALGTAPVVCTFSGKLGGENIALLTLDVTLITSGTVAIAETTPGVASTQKGALKGAALTDTTNGIAYINTGTDYSATWTKVGTQT